MERSIDREKVIKGLGCLLTTNVPCAICPYINTGSCINAICDGAKALLKEQLEIVRCKDCKYGNPAKNAKGETMIECALMYEDWLRDPDWFCANGRRKE